MGGVAENDLSLQKEEGEGGERGNGLSHAEGGEGRNKGMFLPCLERGGGGGGGCAKSFEPTIFPFCNPPGPLTVIFNDRSFITY